MRMIRLGSLFSLIAALCVWLGSCSTAQVSPIVLNVAATGLFREALAEVDQIWQQKNLNIVVNYTTTGAEVLQQRIEQGEDFDLLLTMAAKPLDELEQKGLTLPETRQPFVATQIALIAPIDSPLELSDFKDLTSDRVRTVAMSLRKLGVSVYTNEVLTNLNILQVVQTKGLLAETDVREILNAVETGRADVGITYLSEAQQSDKVKVFAVASPSLHRPIVGGLVVLKRSQYVPEAEQFAEFLQSQQAMAVFQQNGFELSPS